MFSSEAVPFRVSTLVVVSVLGLGLVLVLRPLLHSINTITIAIIINH